MAEVVGVVASAATLAGIFKVCIEVFDIIRTYQNQEKELTKLTLRLNVEKCRLYVWGQAMGLSSSSSSRHAGAKKKPLDNCPFLDTVEESLNAIIHLFNDSHKIKHKYGCKEASQSMRIEDDRSNTIKKFTASFGNLRIRGAGNQTRRKGEAPAAATVLQKTQWVVYDQKKFRLLIQEAKELIDGLQDITKGLSSVAQQDEVIYARVMNIRDVATLDMVADVCEEDHPQIAYAASTRADSISMATDRKQNIAEWRAGIESEESDDTSVANLEAMTVTELKYQISRLLHDRQQLQLPKAKVVVNDAGTAETQEPQTQEQEIEVLKQVVTGLEKERDFYFSKLRDIELLVEAGVEESPPPTEDVVSFFKTVQTILYAVEEGFEIPNNDDDDKAVTTPITSRSV